MRRQRFRPALSGQISPKQPFLVQGPRERGFHSVGLGRGEDSRTRLQGEAESGALEHQRQIDVGLSRAKLATRAADKIQRRLAIEGRESAGASRGRFGLGRNGCQSVAHKHACAAAAISDPRGKDAIAVRRVHDQRSDRGDLAVAKARQRRLGPALADFTAAGQQMHERCSRRGQSPIDARDRRGATLLLDESDLAFEVVRVRIGLIQGHDDLAVGRPVFQDREQGPFQRCDAASC